MKQNKLPTALIGFGKMAQGYASDAAMARFYEYATHAQVLTDHPKYEWTTVVDHSFAACQIARNDWGVKNVALTPSEIANSIRAEIEVAVIATPPEQRDNLLESFPNLRAVLVEKPLGVDVRSSINFVAECERRGIAVQVNLWRRADTGLRQLALGQLSQLVGDIQTVFAIYGNGLENNGTHIIDMARMLFGEVIAVQNVTTREAFVEGPIILDSNPTFVLKTERNVSVVVSPVRFSEYRENGLSIWGTSGRLDIMNEGLTIQHFRREANRAMSEEHEISSDKPRYLPSTVGSALYEMYSNLAEAIDGGANLFSSGKSAIKNAMIVEEILSLNTGRG